MNRSWRWVALAITAFTMTSCRSGTVMEKTDELVANQAMMADESWGLKLVKVQGEYESRAGIKDGIRHLNIEYYANQLMEVEEARAAITDTMERLLRALNRDEKLRPSILEYPLTVENITMNVKLQHFFGDYFDPVYIEKVTVEDGYVSYYTHRNKIKKREPYNQALREVADLREEELRQAEM